MTSAVPGLSVVVVSYNMARELPRTMRTLSVPYQRDIRRDDYEVVLIDNGSARPPEMADFADLDVNLRLMRHPAPTPSPADALNIAVASTAGDLVGVMVDGARMLSPGVLGAALRASQTGPRTIVATLSFHLGPDLQWISARFGYNQAQEDRLLDSAGWTGNGYRLFDVAPRTDQNKDGWFGALFESNALFMPRTLWQELGGYDTAFTGAGGGWANADFFYRATSLPDTRLVVLLGEGSFHQIHGGEFTNAGDQIVARLRTASRDYIKLRGRIAYRFKGDTTYYGPCCRDALDAFNRAPLTRLSIPATRQKPERGATLYTELLKTVLLNEHALDAEARAEGGNRTLEHAERERAVARLRWNRTLGLGVNGIDHTVPPAYTMIGRKRLDHLAECVATVLDEGIPGDLIECGVWRGGASILMRGILLERGVSDRRVWVADSFAGLPVPHPDTDEGLDLSAERNPELAVSLEDVQANFDAFGLLDHQVRFLKGWFADTLAPAPIQQIAVLRADGDLYSSTTDILEALYERVVPGGFVVIDDYGGSSNAPGRCTISAAGVA
jgi:glycosyltransferase involved in cell wall biosynthesis